MYHLEKRDLELLDEIVKAPLGYMGGGGHGSSRSLSLPLFSKSIYEKKSEDMMKYANYSPSVGCHSLVRLPVRNRRVRAQLVAGSTVCRVSPLTGDIARPRELEAATTRLLNSWSPFSTFCELEEWKYQILETWMTFGYCL